MKKILILLFLIGLNSNAATMPYAPMQFNSACTQGVSNLATGKCLEQGSGKQYITSGTTYTTPSNISSLTQFSFTLIGGGGGSGGMATTNGRGAGGGGGGGCKVNITGLTPSTAYAIAIGAGGVAGASTPTIGGAGGNTTLVIGANTYEAAGGGEAALGVSTVGGIPGGASATCSLGIAGSWGGWTNAANVNAIAGKGGDSPFGYGMGGAGVGTNTFFGTCIPGGGYGGGAGGASDVGSAVAGCAGAPGIIVVEWWN